MLVHKINPVYKKMWVEALLSGKYRQGHDQLKTSSGEYCCLGVLCSIVKPKVKWVGKGALPPEVMRKIEYPDPNGTGDILVKYEGMHKYLSELNDFEGLDFNQIASIIEEQL